ncbi:prepilin-type N-terminal cleavage/methylation domain-containing protein [Rouxiella badensis]|jgi:prepilin peptidase dependent protein C|uniref:Prepilin-type N-terminal cleavage/methylation domain-containing protein n=1 Tax=Rouxiella badensis TaxID=1646377 RepID=A0A1X0WEN1_9GAMM|nr:prepilin-type N-terminal cleavage/methylation domain-containing protein [Rouxiella badensis]MCC3749275.1 prepilin-type cleavage/methylation domain-containing protein [Rouxiella badensis]ORJ25268.1 prepilin-type N-terminal cleavage/methylation domain-containing protein [Rouxiella badensis]QOI56320.1 prepilin-type cleavage/methylation domain-containing protein [Rouxiella badensis subsp. acadiensis]WAT06162.1 prepilin-type cleavage/methylation domain-containing protein [Rouxiella badensis]WAT0
MTHNQRLHPQAGLSLPETMLATLLLSVSVLGLLNYYQSLTQGFSRQWQVRQAWTEAHEQLESFAVLNVGKALDKPGWSAQITRIQTSTDCQWVTARVETPLHYTSRLSRMICRPIVD